MPRYDARSRGTWEPDLLDEDDEFSPDELFLAEEGDDYEIDDNVVTRQPATGTRRSGVRRQRGRDRRSDQSAAQGKQRRDSAVADVEELDDLEFEEALLPRQRDRKRVEVSEGFKCRHCRNFIGIPPSGGRNRNHCPLCLYSLHVDGKTPGDRASDCRSLMQPVGVFYRPKGEQMVVHSCLGCGFVRYNRIAADDNPIVLSELPVLDPPSTGKDWAQGE